LIHIRHSAIFTIPENEPITIIGCGGLGATTALTLAKMGYRYMTIFDDDVVSPENLATQLHKPSDVGNAKVHALTGILRDFSDDVTVDAVPERVGIYTRFHSPIVISAVDSIKARQEIWQSVLSSKCEWYIEMRMGAEEMNLHSVNMKDPASVKWYDEYITGQDDASIPDAPCTEKATFFCSMVASGFVGSIVRKLKTNLSVPKKLVVNLISNTLMQIG
jgi:hypothetical protein